MERLHLEKQPALECGCGAASPTLRRPSWPGMHFAALIDLGLGSMEFLLSSYSFVSVKKKKHILDYSSKQHNT